MKRYIATLSQAGDTTDPTGTESGSITGASFARGSEGVYTITKTGAFPASNTFCFKPNMPVGVVGTEFDSTLVRTSDDVLTLKVYDETGTLVDGFSALTLYVIVDQVTVDGAAEYAMVDLADVKTYLKITGTSLDDLLQDWLNRASHAIENYCRRKFKQQTITNSIEDGNGEERFYPFWTPIVSVTSIEYRQSPDDSWVTLESDSDHIFLKANEPYYIELYGNIFPFGVQNLRLNYSAGFETIPGEILQVLYEMIQTQYNEAKQGNDWLGKGSFSLGGTTTMAGNVRDMWPRWKDVLDRYRRLPY